MTTQFTRPVRDDRILRGMAAYNLPVDLSTGLGQLWDAPTWTGLAGQQVDIGQARETAFSPEQQFGMEQERTEYDTRAFQLENAIGQNPFEDMSAEKEELDALRKQHDVFLSNETQRSIDEGRIRTPEDLATEYGHIGLTFDRNMATEEAQLLYDNKKAEVIRNAIIARSPSGFMPATAKFAVGLAAMAVDPLELATMFIPVVGPAGRVAAAAKFGRVGGRAAVGATEGLVGSALTEPFYYGLSRAQQLDYTMYDALLNIGLGTVLGGGIGAGIGAFSRADAPRVEPAPRAPDIEIDTPQGPVRIAAPEPAKPAKRAEAKAAQEQADIAIRQFVNDQEVDVSILTQRAPKRPQNAMEFVRGIGGINDADPSFRGELEKLEIRPAPNRNGVNNPYSKLNLDDAAELAHEAGFITNRDTNELIDALRETRDGNFVFSMEDAETGANWRDFHAAKNDTERMLSEYDSIRSDLSDLGVDEIPDGEIAMISDAMARNGGDVDAAYDMVGIRLNEKRAEILAENAQDIEADPFADGAASREVTAALDVDSEARFEDMKAMVDNIEPDETELAMIKESTDKISEAEAYEQLSKIAANCVLGS